MKKKKPIQITRIQKALLKDLMKYAKEVFEHPVHRDFVNGVVKSYCYNRNIKL